MRTLNTSDSFKHTRWETQLLMSSITPWIRNEIDGEAKYRGNSKGHQRYQKTFLPSQFCSWLELPG